MDLASGPTFFRLENAVSSQDLYRLAQAFVDQFIASYAQPPAVIVLDLDHSEDPGVKNWISQHDALLT